ncbi:MAG TPA: NADPH-dependent FMN reductase [Gaiellaceae bacterium]
MRVLGIPGSLRAGSYNRALLRAARELAPAGMEIVDFDIRELPFYDGDVEAAGDPEPVTAFKDAIRSADAVLIATPEYNRGVPGVLKNAIDWASRPPLGSPLSGKPVAIMGASTGLGGTARAQEQLRAALEFSRAHVLAQPELLVPEAYLSFDADGRLTDDRVRAGIAELLAELARSASGAEPDLADHPLTASAEEHVEQAPAPEKAYAPA